MKSDPSTDDTAGTTSKARMPLLASRRADNDVLHVIFTFIPLRARPRLRQCSGCWAVVEADHMNDHADWHATILHVRGNGG